MSKFTPRAFWGGANLDNIKSLSGAILDNFSIYFRIFKLCGYTYLHQIKISMHFFYQKFQFWKQKKWWGKRGHSSVKTSNIYKFHLFCLIISFSYSFKMLIQKFRWFYFIFYCPRFAPPAFLVGQKKCLLFV